MNITRKRLYHSLAESFCLNFYLPDSSLIAPPAAVYAADCDLTTVIESAAPPQAVMMKITDGLMVLSPDGSMIGTLDECMRKLNCRAYPILCFTTERVGKEIVDYADENCIGDMTLCVPYTHRTLLPAVREALPLSRGMLDCRGMNLPENLLEMVGECQVSEATMVMLDIVPKRMELRRLQKRFLQVFIAVDSYSCMADALLAGACGIVTGNPTSLYALIDRFPHRSTVRPTPLYAHKGLHITDEFPENTVKACVAAGERGYDAAEIDISLTADDVAIVQHDSTTGDLFDSDLNVKQSTFEELSHLRRSNFPDSGLDRFEDVMTAMADYPDTPVLMEIKTPAATYGVEEMVYQMRELLKRPDVQRDCTCIMGFNPPYLSYVHKHLPRLPLAHISGKIPGMSKPVDTDGWNLFLYQFVDKSRGMNAAINLYYPTGDALFARLAHLRGITVFPWSGAFMPWECKELSEVFAAGYDGLTSDWVTKFAEFPVELLSKLEAVYPSDLPIAPVGKLLLRTGEEIVVEKLTVIPLEGDITLHEDGTFSGNGTVRVALAYRGELPDGETLCLCSEAVCVELSSRASKER